MNHQENSILERIHQVIENLVCKFDLKNIYLDEDEPWSGILEATSFAVYSTYRTKLQATPGQLVFGHNMVLYTPSISDWEDIRKYKQQIIDKETKMKIKTANHIFIEYMRKYSCTAKKRTNMRIRTNFLIQ